MFAVERYDQAPVQTQIYPRQCVSIWSIVLSVRIIWSFSQQDNSLMPSMYPNSQLDKNKDNLFSVIFHIDNGCSIENVYLRFIIFADNACHSQSRGVVLTSMAVVAG